MTNKTKILAIVCAVFLAAAGVFTGLMIIHDHNVPVDPPVTSLVLVSPDGTGAAGIVMRTYDNPLTGADMQKLRDMVNAKLKVQPAAQTVAILPATDGNNRTVVYGYSVGRDGKRFDYTSKVSSSQNITDVYSKGVAWFTGQTNWPIVTTAVQTENNSDTSKSSNGLSLSLTLDSITHQPGQGIAITLDESNTLPALNNVPAAENWSYSHLQKDPCDFISPFGLAVFRGDYTALNISSATPLTVYDPHATRLCPYLYPVTAYSFQPSSDMANPIRITNPSPTGSFHQLKYELTIQGYWPDNVYSSNSQLTTFDTGVYTVVGGDEWGNVVVLHFYITE